MKPSIISKCIHSRNMCYTSQTQLRLLAFYHNFTNANKTKIKLIDFIAQKQYN